MAIGTMLWAWSIVVPSALTCIACAPGAVLAALWQPFWSQLLFHAEITVGTTPGWQLTQPLSCSGPRTSEPFGADGVIEDGLWQLAQATLSNVVPTIVMLPVVFASWLLGR